MLHKGWPTGNPASGKEGTAKVQRTAIAGDTSITRNNTSIAIRLGAKAPTLARTTRASPSPGDDKRSGARRRLSSRASPTRGPHARVRHRQTSPRRWRPRTERQGGESRRSRQKPWSRLFPRTEHPAEDYCFVSASATCEAQNNSNFGRRDYGRHFVCTFVSGFSHGRALERLQVG